MDDASLAHKYWQEAEDFEAANDLRGRMAVLAKLVGLSRRMKDARRESVARCALGDTFLDLGDSARAEEQFKEYLRINEGAADPRRMLAAHKRLAKLYSTWEGKQDNVAAHENEIVRVQALVDADAAKRKANVATVMSMDAATVVAAPLPKAPASGGSSERGILDVLEECERTLKPERLRNVMRRVSAALRSAARSATAKASDVHLDRDLDTGLVLEMFELAGWPIAVRSDGGKKKPKKGKPSKFELHMAPGRTTPDRDAYDAIMIFASALEEEVEDSIAEDAFSHNNPAEDHHDPAGENNNDDDVPPVVVEVPWTTEYDKLWGRVETLELAKDPKELASLIATSLLPLAREHGDVRREATALCRLGLALRNCGDVDGAVGTFRQYRQAGERSMDFRIQRTACRHMGDTLLGHGDAEGALREYCAYLDLADVVNTAAGNSTAHQHGRSHLCNAKAVDSVTAEVEKSMVRCARMLYGKGGARALPAPQLSELAPPTKSDT
eukprot:PhM_4_TR6518/c0_g1_i1/m.7098